MPNQEFDLTHCQSAQQVLLEYLEFRQKAQPEFSLRQWSRQLGFNSHTLLQFWIKGKRRVRTKYVDLLSESMGLTDEEKNFFSKLVQFENERDSLQRAKLLREFSSSETGKDTFIVDQFKVMANWLPLALLALQKFDHKKAYAHFEHKATHSEIDSSILRLQRLDLIEENTGEFGVVVHSLNSRNDIVDVGVRTYHKNVLEMAKDAIEEQSLDQREFQSFAVGVDLANIDLAKKMIRRFRKEFAASVGGSRENICQMNIQFFQLSRIPVEKKDRVANIATDSNDLNGGSK